MIKQSLTRAGVVAGLLLLAGCQVTAPRVGSDSARTAATGSAGGANAANESSQLERCDQPFGTISVVENQNADWYRVLTSEYRLTSTVPVLRLLMQQSNCFIVVERGRAVASMQTERALQQGGELREGSSFGAGQVVAADYSINPEVLVSQRNTSGMTGAISNWGGGLGGTMLRSVAGGIRSNEAATLLTLVDNRSGVQVGIAEGASRNTDFNLRGVASLAGNWGRLGGYTNTPQGKVIAAAFMDAYNQLVVAMRSYQPQTMGDRDLGVRGRLAVDGAPAPVTRDAPAPAAPAAR